MDFNARAHAVRRAAGLGRNNRRVGRIHRLTRRPQLAASHRTWSRAADADARARAYPPDLAPGPVGRLGCPCRPRTAILRAGSVSTADAHSQITAAFCGLRGVNRMCQQMNAGGGMWHRHGPAAAAPPTASQQSGRRTSPPHWPATPACSGMGRVKVACPKISSIRGAGMESRSIPLEASSLGGSMEQAGGRSAPGHVGDLRLDSFRVTPCSRKTAPGGSRQGRAGSTCSPAIGWHRFSELQRRYVAAADHAGG
jgi:hypothetical protein